MENKNINDVCANKIIEIISALKEGKTVMWKNSQGYFCTLDNIDGLPHLMDYLSNDYTKIGFVSIEKEPEYRPYRNAEELMKDYMKNSGVIKNKKKSHYYTIIMVDGEYNKVLIKESAYYDLLEFENLFKYFTWYDGSKCGVKE